MSCNCDICPFEASADYQCKIICNTEDKDTFVPKHICAPVPSDR